MGWWIGTELQLRRPEMEQMLEEHERDPSALRRRGCTTCVTLVTVWIILMVILVVVNVT